MLGDSWAGFEKDNESRALENTFTMMANSNELRRTTKVIEEVVETLETCSHSSRND